MGWFKKIWGLVKELEKVWGMIEALDYTLQDHEERISKLEGGR